MSDDTTVWYASGGDASHYHRDRDCRVLVNHAARKTTRDAVPHREPCQLCCGDGIDPTNDGPALVNQLRRTDPEEVFE